MTVLSSFRTRAGIQGFSFEPTGFLPVRELQDFDNISDIILAGINNFDKLPILTLGC